MDARRPDWDSNRLREAPAGLVKLGGIMTIQQLEYLADGLSVSACGQILAIDRTRVRQTSTGHDVSFVVAGTGLAPRLHLSPGQLSTSTWEELSATLRLVTARLACRP
jgi:hypothetical protein